MLIPGHVGFTLGLATLIKKSGRLNPLKMRQLLIFGFLALLPDILDKSLHLVFPTYPDHLIFHSLPFYAIALSVLWLCQSRCLLYGGVMAFHPVLDLANTDPRALLFPLFGWPAWINVQSVPEKAGLLGLPSLIPASHLTGIYVIFEVVGLFLMAWAIWSSAKNTPCLRKTKSED